MNELILNIINNYFEIEKRKELTLTTLLSECVIEPVGNDFYYFKDYQGDKAIYFVKYPKDLMFMFNSVLVYYRIFEEFEIGLEGCCNFIQEYFWKTEGVKYAVGYGSSGQL
jgi:hypothetical protein